MLVRVDLVEHALRLVEVLRARGAVSRLAGPRRRRTARRGAAYHIAAGVLELVREFLHPLVEFFDLRGINRLVSPSSTSAPSRRGCK